MTSVKNWYIICYMHLMGLLVPVSACFGDGHGSIIALNEFVSWSRVAGEEKGGQVLTVQ